MMVGVTSINSAIIIKENHKERDIDKSKARYERVRISRLFNDARLIKLPSPFSTPVFESTYLIF